MQISNISLDREVLEAIFTTPSPEVSAEEIQAVLDCGEIVRLKHSSGNTNSSGEATVDGALEALAILTAGRQPSL